MLPINGFLSAGKVNWCNAVCAAACTLSAGACAGVCLIDGPSPLADIGGTEVSAIPGGAGGFGGASIASAPINGN